MGKVGLYWFEHDLRLHDNAGLSKAAAESDSLLDEAANAENTPQRLVVYKM